MSIWPVFESRHDSKEWSKRRVIDGVNSDIIVIICNDQVVGMIILMGDGGPIILSYVLWDGTIHDVKKLLCFGRWRVTCSASNFLADNPFNGEQHPLCPRLCHH